MDNRLIPLAKALAVLIDSQKSRPGLLLDRLERAEKNLDEAISKVDTIGELVDNIGSEVINIIVALGLQYIKKTGPLGLAEAVLRGAKEVDRYFSKEP